MRYFQIAYCVLCTSTVLAQAVPLGNFELKNVSSPAFLIAEESPTQIYTPQNVKALTAHVLDNFGESLSVELAPYFFINTQQKNRTYQKYIGVGENEAGKLVQKPFSGVNTTTISIAYLDKEFDTSIGARKTYAFGLRTTLLRFYNKQEVQDNTQQMQDALSNITVPVAVLQQGEEAIKAYYNDLLLPVQRTIEPIFKLDAALGYATFFENDTFGEDTVNRFGSWVTAELNLILNKDAGSPRNNYLSAFAIVRYVEDGFIPNQEGDLTTIYYRDVGGKLAAELGRFTLGYEFIKRFGLLETERSVGTLSYLINKNVSIIGGFGKDFPEADNLITLFGINWGFNLGQSEVPFD